MQNQNLYTRELKNSFKYQNPITDVFPQSIPIEFKKYLEQFPKDHPLNLQFIPHENELQDQGLYDPIGDLKHSKGHGIIHRYKTRLLFTPTTVCPIQCRYCFRKNELAQNDTIFNQNISKLKEYLTEHSEVKEVILTGGDPLILTNKKLFAIFEQLKDQVDYIRIHTRTPIIIPGRIDEEFIDFINHYSSKFKLITMALHTNHALELYPEVLEKMNLLRATKIKLISQSVLLKHVNDNVQSLCDLFFKLSENGIQPYYLHHPDKVKGAMHFYLKLKAGREIYARLRDELPGHMIPHYVIDPSNGRGKTLAYNSESLEFGGHFVDRFAQSYPYQEEV
jgi:lysine 2,3-aminomutase